eukprot:gnl/MRDRNA2_/MRDRNA2_94994_c0_seq1.p1 gnl/MRDRNA2_/MRDRNA2_94994_c0~~gnl/MRDRNA2_/MRDRNA2_94994_c0_seq1.p1  ORF type:complete len:637 (+),score=181.83 gnl/MRDRNA2_/MRDRNA2_94994_c0_seq1:72-1982(+)
MSPPSTIQEAVSVIEKNSKDVTKVNLSGIAVDEIAAFKIAKVLDRNDTCQVLSVADCNVNDESAKKIWEVLKKNKKITSLNFKCNKIGDKACLAIGECLIDNSKIMSVDLSSNEIGLMGTEALAAALDKNSTLTSLSLACNNITLAGLEKIADVFADQYNKTPITKLDLRSTKMSDQGAKRIAEAIERKGTVAELYISYNSIGDVGVKPIAELLVKNTPLKVLDLRGNVIAYEGAKLLVGGLNKNKGMQVLYLGYNKIPGRGLSLITEAEKKQRTVAVDGAREELQEADPEPEEEEEEEDAPPPKKEEPKHTEAEPVVEEKLEAADVGTTVQELRGEKYDKALLKLALKSMKDGSINKKDAEKLWKSAMDQKKVTDAEAKTLQFIVSEYKVEEDAKQFFLDKLGFSEVKVNGGANWYEKDLLKLADSLSKDGIIDKKDAEKLWTAAMDEKKVTDFEAKTLQYIMSAYNVAEDGKKILLDKMGLTEINGQWYEKDLMDLALKSMKDGKLDLKEAKKLWKSAMDEKNVTDIEAKTLQYIMSQNVIDDDAEKFLFEKLGFKQIEGQWYEEDLLKLATKSCKNEEGVIDFNGAQKLWKAAMDAGIVTEVEARTLRYIMSEHQFAESARKFLEDQLSLVGK